MPNTLTTPRRRLRQIGPDDHGRRMSLAEFDIAHGQEGYLYELNKGVIDVTNIPHRRHFMLLADIRDQLIAYKTSNPGIIQAVGGSDNTKVLIESEQSERHPDIAVYTSPMPDVDEIWSIWVPTIAVEIVSESSAKRDYQDKPGRIPGIRDSGILDYRQLQKADDSTNPFPWNVEAQDHQALAEIHHTPSARIQSGSETRDPGCKVNRRSRG